MINRRGLLVAAAGLFTGPGFAATLPPMIVHRYPSCGCCGAWVDIMRAAGFAVTVKEHGQMDRVKQSLGVPSELQSCHTAEIAGFVIEGHVPPAEVKRLLAEAPKGRGLTVPGMPIGSPGMEVAGAKPDTYSVLLFGSDAPSIFARYTGSSRL